MQQSLFCSGEGVDLWVKGTSRTAWWEDRDKNIAPSWQGKGEVAWTCLWRVDGSGSVFLSGL